jgi:hypothetical protein
VFPDAFRVVPKMERVEYFRGNRESIRMDGWVAGEHASCSGVNLAFAGLGGWFVIRRGVEAVPLQSS